MRMNQIALRTRGTLTGVAQSLNESLQPIHVRTATIALVLFGILYRLRDFVFRRSYWYDESFLLLVLPGRSFFEYFQPLPYNAVGPPGYLLIIGSLAQFGIANELVMRLPAFLAGIAALLLIVPLANRMIDGRSRLWVVACASFGSMAVIHGSEVHPYTFDILFCEAALLLALRILQSEPGACRSGRWMSLVLFGAVSMWFSLPSAFILGGANAALIFCALRRGARTDWFWLIAFNAIVCISGLVLYFAFARHMYYEGMIEHWGHRGWRGFPDWQSAWGILTWMLERPFTIAHYAHKEAGVTLALLAAFGAYSLARQSREKFALLVGPGIIALGFALVGRYPLADRTVFFLAPCVWLLSAAGVAALWQQGQAGKLLVGLAALNLLYTLIRAMICVVEPHAGIPYRDGYEYVHARMQDGDILWAHMGVVHRTYHGERRNVYIDHQEREIIAQAATKRIWTVGSPRKTAFYHQIETAGGRLILHHQLNRQLEVRLYAPHSDATPGP